MILEFKDMSEHSQEGQELLACVKQFMNGQEFTIYSDGILQTSCPSCGDDEFWNMYDKECNHCGYGK